MREWMTEEFFQAVEKWVNGVPDARNQPIGLFLEMIDEIRFLRVEKTQLEESEARSDFLSYGVIRLDQEKAGVTQESTQNDKDSIPPGGEPDSRGPDADGGADAIGTTTATEKAGGGTALDLVPSTPPASAAFPGEGMSKEELREIEKRAHAATPGTWTLKEDMGAPWIVTQAQDAPLLGGLQYYPTAPDDPADWEFIAHARQDIPALIAEVRRLQTLLDSKETQK